MTVANLDDEPPVILSMNADGQPYNDEEELKSEGGENVSLVDQKNIIEGELKEPLVAGDTWYLVDMRWLKQWRKYVNLSEMNRNDVENPGPIDNSPLLEPGTSKVKERKLAGHDYEVISKKGWDCLVDWYGLLPEQEPISRKVVNHGLYVKETKVEVYLTELKLSTFADTENVKVWSFSEADTIADVVKKAKGLFEISENEETRLWHKVVAKTYELISKLDHTLQDTGIGSGQVLVLEQKNEQNEWPRPTRSRSVSSSASMNGIETSSTGSFNKSRMSPSSYGRQRHMSIKPGLCGLSNLGNTCFMNSALQCLSNTTPLMKYFTSETYKHDINPNNPLGMHGNIAEAYAELVNNMWNGHNTFFSPRHFKMQVGRFAPQFSGYQQQDSHELLAFLLDGLHEDLNRVKQKPYIELQDDKGRPDEMVAGEAWHNHSLRNSSIIVDYFHGQFKSTVECPICHKRSVTFDPFCYLSLPLPVKKERNLHIVFVPLDTLKKPIKLKVTVPKGGKIEDLTHAVAEITGNEPDKLIVTDVFGSKFHKKYLARESLSQITDRDDIFVFEIPIPSDKLENEELLLLPVYLREIKSSKSQYSYSYSYSTNCLFGVPMFVPVPRTSTTTKDLYKLILRAMRRFVTYPTNDSCEEDESLKEKEDKKEEDWHNEIDGNDEETKMNNDGEETKQDDVEFCEVGEEELESTNQAQPANLFEIKIVNSAGTQDIGSLDFEDEKPLKLTPKTHLAIDWYPKLKKKYYNESLSIDYEKHPNLDTPPAAKKTIRLSDCLELFLQKEKLGEEDPWYCPECKEHRQAFKKFDLWTLPKILVIHLKRFSYNRYWRDKIDALVDFPVRNLDLTDNVINKDHPRAVYDLHAVSNHYGGLGGGHYTAYAVNCYDGQWYYFDDSSVSQSNSSSPVSKAAYVLFYTRRDDPDSEMLNTSELITEDVFEEAME